MATNGFRVKSGSLNIKSGTSGTESGDITVNSNELEFHNGSSAKKIATETNTVTFSNKTLDNTTVATVKDANLTIQDDADTTKQLKFQASGITTGTTRTLTAPDANTTIVGTDATQTLSNKTLDNTTTLTIQDANLTIQDNLDNTKQLKLQASGIATGTTRTLTAPNADTTIVGDDAVQTLINKTFNDSVTIAEISTPSTPSSGFGRIYFKSDGFLYQLNDDGTETKVGAGSGNINYVLNPDAESNTTGWSTYADAASNIPANGTGGSPNSTWTRSTSSPLRKTASFLWSKTGSANRQGEGVSYDFTIDSADQAKPLAVTFDYIVASGTFTASDGITAPLNDNTTSTNAGNSDLEVFVYDVTNSTLIPVAPQVLTSNSSTTPNLFKGVFQTSSNSTAYRLIIHTATSTTNNFTVKFDNFFVGPQAITYGSPVGDWVSFTPTISGLGTGTSNITGKYRRIGDSAEIQIMNGMTSAGTGGGLVEFGIAAIGTVDSNKHTAAFTAGFGYTNSIETSAQVASVVVQKFTSTTFYIADNGSNANGYLGSDFRNGSEVILRLFVPITGWSSTTVMSHDTDTRVVAAIISGDPASATSGNPIIVPTVGYDSHGAYNASTGRYTVPVSGIYKVYGALTSASSATTLTVYKNAISTSLAGSLDSNGEATFNTAVQCVAGDIIDIRPGGTVDATSMSLNIERLSGPATVAASESVAVRYTSGSSTVANNSTQIFNFDTKVYDTHNAVTTGASWKFTAPIPGKYMVTCRITYASATTSAGQILAMDVYKNSVAYGNLVRRIVEAGVTDLINVIGVGTVVHMVSGDYIDVRAYQNTGATRTAYSDHTYTAVEITRIP